MKFTKTELKDRILSLGLGIVKFNENTIGPLNCIIDGLISNKINYNKGGMIMRYSRWYNGLETVPDSVKSERQFYAKFKGIKSVKEFNKIMTIHPGNSSIMRSGILSILKFKSEINYQKAVLEDCYLTNPNILDHRCSILLTTAISMVLCKFSKLKIMSKIIETVKSYESQILFKYIMAAVSDKFIEPDDTTVYTLYKLFNNFIYHEEISSPLTYIIKKEDIIEYPLFTKKLRKLGILLTNFLEEFLS